MKTHIIEQGANRLKRRRGLSLTEAIIAIFIIVYCVLTVFQLLHMGVDMDGKAERSLTAALVSEKQLARVRLWASNTTNFTSDWSTATPPIVGAYLDNDFPQYNVTIAATNLTVYSPCTQTEQNWVGPPDERRAMTSSFKKVCITVSWDPSVPTSQVQIASLVGAPTQVGVSIAATLGGASPSSVHQNATVDFSNITALDSTNTPIPDVFFTWTQSPTTSTGSVGSFQNQTRTGQAVQFQNFYCNEMIGGSNQTVFGPTGAANVTVTGRAGGDISASNIMQIVATP